MIDAWVFNFMQALGPEEPDYSDPAVLQRTYDWHMDLCVQAEDLGFKGVFFSEHHFLNLFPADRSAWQPIAKGPLP